jgi:enoyl-CoA hydratase
MGAFLLLSTDLRIGLADGARFQVNEVRIGMTVPHFALEVCRQRLAPNQLHSAAALGMPFSPVQALAAGFLDEIVAGEDLAATVQRHAQDLLSLNPEAFTITKRRLRAEALAAMTNAIVADGADWRASGLGH